MEEMLNFALSKSVNRQKVSQLILSPVVVAT